MVGLSYSDVNYHYNTINYAWYVHPYSGGGYAIYESGSSIGGQGASAVGYKLKILRDNGTIRYYKNGVLRRSVADANQSTPMIVDIAMYRTSSTQGNKVQNLVVGKKNRPNSQYLCCYRLRTLFKWRLSLCF